MASMNPFDLLVDDDAGDPAVLIAAYEQKLAVSAAASAAANTAATTKPQAKLPSKPLPPAQAVREGRNEGGRGRGGRSYGRGGRGAGGPIQNRENHFPNDNGFSSEVEKPTERRGGFDDSRPRGGGRRGGYSNGDADGERPRRNYERRSGTGRGSEIKRDGAGRGNWGTTSDDIAPEALEPVTENEVSDAVEKPAGEEENVDAEKKTAADETEEKEPEEKQMTLEEYEKVREEKRKALLSLSEEKRGEERKVDVQEFQAMQLVSKKKDNDEVFIKLGSEKDKRREAAEREEKAKKSVSINEFLKPADGEGHYRSGGRGGRGRGGGRGRSGGGGYSTNSVRAPSIEDQNQFPTLGGK